MSLKAQILGVKRKTEAQLIATQVVDGRHSIEELMSLFFSDDWVICQKTSWAITMIADKDPDILLPYIPRMIDQLSRANHDAVIRNTIRTWQVMTIPEEYEGPIYDQCFEYFADPSYAVAIRVFAMTVCTNIAMRHPSLAQEIMPIIEDNWDHSTAAWRSRGRKELKRLYTVVS